MQDAGLHHVALRVRDLEGAISFYRHVVDAEPVVLPFATSGPLAELIMGGPPGVAFKSCMLRIGHDYLELFEFEQPHDVVAPVHPSRGNILHICIRVTTVEDALRRAEELGGRRLWPDVQLWGDARAIYVADPDGNVIELIDTPMPEVVRMTHQMFPRTEPATDPRPPSGSGGSR